MTTRELFHYTCHYWGGICLIPLLIDLTAGGHFPLSKNQSPLPTPPHPAGMYAPTSKLKGARKFLVLCTVKRPDTRRELLENPQFSLKENPKKMLFSKRFDNYFM